jgi:hypothetical protein
MTISRAGYGSSFAPAPMMLLQWKSRRWVEISDGFYSCRDHQKVKMTPDRAKPAVSRLRVLNRKADRRMED